MNSPVLKTIFDYTSVNDIVYGNIDTVNGCIGDYVAADITIGRNSNKGNGGRMKSGGNGTGETDVDLCGFFLLFLLSKMYPLDFTRFRPGKFRHIFDLTWIFVWSEGRFDPVLEFLCERLVSALILQ